MCRFKRKCWAVRFARRETLGTALVRYRVFACWTILGFYLQSLLHWRGALLSMRACRGNGGPFCRAPRVQGVGRPATSSVETVVFKLRLRDLLYILPKMPLSSSVAPPEAVFVTLCVTGWSWIGESAPLRRCMVCFFVLCIDL